MKQLSLFLAICSALLSLNCSYNQRQASSTSAASTPTAYPSPVLTKVGLSPVEENKTVVPKDIDAYIMEGDTAFKSNRNKDAVEAYQQAINLNPEHAEAHYKLGLAYAALEQRKEAREEYEKAAEAYKQAVKREPKNAEANFRLGKASAKLGKYDEAVKAYEQAKRLKKDDSPLYYEMGLAYTKIAKYKEAIEAFQKVIELEPNDFHTRELLDKAKDDLHRQQAALDSLDKRPKHK